MKREGPSQERARVAISEELPIVIQATNPPPHVLNVAVDTNPGPGTQCKQKGITHRGSSEAWFSLNRESEVHQGAMANLARCLLESLYPCGCARLAAKAAGYARTGQKLALGPGLV